MDIDAISEQTELDYIFDIPDEPVRWNGRDIRELEAPHYHMHLFNQNRSSMSLDKCKILTQPTMSRPPDKSEAKIKGGYDEDRGGYVEGTWTWTWEDKDDKNRSSDNKDKSSPPKDSGDKNLLKA